MTDQEILDRAVARNFAAHCSLLNKYNRRRVAIDKAEAAYDAAVIAAGSDRRAVYVATAAYEAALGSAEAEYTEALLVG